MCHVRHVLDTTYYRRRTSEATSPKNRQKIDCTAHHFYGVSEQSQLQNMCSLVIVENWMGLHGSLFFDVLQHICWAFFVNDSYLPVVSYMNRWS